MSIYKPLDIDRIEAVRENSRIGKKIVLFHSTASTNDIAWEYAANLENDGLCVLAESQYEGRGRRGRVWFSEPGQSILCSVLLTKTDIEAELLTLTTGVAAAEAITTHCKMPCRIKWPNDILVQEQKVAGILVEKRNINNKSCFVIGIGINCNQTKDSFAGCDLNMPATSLAVETEQDIDRSGLVCELLKHLEIRLAKAGSSKSSSPAENPIIRQWLGLSGMLGRHITVECDGRQYSGFCRGIDPAKGLILQLEHGSVRLFPAAHTSLLGNQ
ncbi:MAG: biotin--[acetyl-CoA-carboxylase] ligase [Planctomycetota bacterium]|jgi:BirA family biotin operon repressor/biotin-[acetyl-CoA-carboxylase] ligase